MRAGIFQNSAAIAKAVSRLTSLIRDAGEKPVLVGIRTNGVPLASRIAGEYAKLTGEVPVLGAIDITLYRDDLAGRALPRVLGSDLPQELDGRRVVLVDDVLYTGRTVRSALIELADYGRPKRVELCVLVDRGLRELPICADYTGFDCPTEPGDHVKVELTESGAAEDAVLLRRG